MTKLTLWELFDDQHALDILSMHCLEKLRQQGASSITDGKKEQFSKWELERFTITPQGITIMFDPYEVGSWVEGWYWVTISFDTLKDVLNDDHPVMNLLLKKDYS